MADPIFDATTFKFAGSFLAPLVSVSYSNSPPEVPTAGSSDTTETVTTGISIESVTVEVLGGPTLAAKSKGATIVAWTDSGTLGTFVHAELTKVANGGGYNGQITTNYTFQPSNA